MIKSGRFENILVVPYTQLLQGIHGGPVHQGGPIWPNWNERNFERHLRGGRPVDTMPEALPAEEYRLDNDVFWAGPIVRHFGHQIADFSMRIHPSRMVDPKARFVFSTRENETVSPWFSQLRDWFEIKESDSIIVRRPTLFASLRVAAQAEYITVGPNSGGPSNEVLDHIDNFIEAKKLGASKSGQIVYVSRAGQHARFAAESYLESLIIEAGGVVMRPESQPLLTQLTTYLSGSRLIFAEGSAVHGLQLCGRGLGSVDILVRRPRIQLAEAQIRPRAKDLSYINGLRGNIHGLLPTGRPARALGLAILDVEKLLAYFDSIGLPARARWNQRDYEQKLADDIGLWIKRELSSERGRVRGCMDHIRGTMAEAGLDHLGINVAV